VALEDVLGQVEILPWTLFARRCLTPGHGRPGFARHVAVFPALRLYEVVLARIEAHEEVGRVKGQASARCDVVDAKALGTVVLGERSDVGCPIGIGRKGNLEVAVAGHQVEERAGSRHSRATLAVGHLVGLPGRERKWLANRPAFLGCCRAGAD